MTESVKKTAKPGKAARKSADPAETGNITESVNQELPEKDGNDPRTQKEEDFHKKIREIDKGGFCRCPCRG